MLIISSLTYASPLFTDIVVGMPRGNNLAGTVALYDDLLRPLPRIGNLSGQQIGSYFGYSLAVADFNGDTLDDVAVGAPFYASYSEKAPKKVELGRVYVFYQSSALGAGFDLSPSRADESTLQGEKEKGRFGCSLAALGDIDLDGFNDLAVGAPYGGEDARGSVHIFRGGTRGLAQEAAQVIEAQTINARLRAFGFSLSGGTDLDVNGYPDVLVGAPESAQAVLLKARPVVKMRARLTAGSGAIDPKVKACPKENPQYACDTLSLQFDYAGEKVPEDLLLTLHNQVGVGTSLWCGK